MGDARGLTDAMFGLDALPRSLEAALRDLGDSKSRVRASAAKDLAAHAGAEGGSRAAHALATALREDASAEVRAASAVALADARAEGATDALLGALEDAHLAVRQMALLALGEIGDGGDAPVVRAVETARADSAAAMRFQALIASQRLNVPGVEEALLAALNDADDAIRHIALRLLEERTADDSDTPRPAPFVVAAVKEALDDAALGVRLAAAILLARAGHAEGRGIIAEVAGGVRAAVDEEDEQTAVVLAGELGLEAARRGLERRAFPRFGGARFTYEARIALALMGDSRARAAIVKGLGSLSRDARTLAVVAVGRAGVKEARPILLAMKTDPRRAEPEAVGEALEALGRFGGAS